MIILGCTSLAWASREGFLEEKASKQSLEINDSHPDEERWAMDFRKHNHHKQRPECVGAGGVCEKLKVQCNQMHCTR